MLSGSRLSETDDGRLAGTPFESMPDPASGYPLSRAERANVVFVLATSQVLQVGAVAIVSALIFFVLGLILLSPELLAQWTRNGSTDGRDPRHDVAGTPVADSDQHVSGCTDVHVRQRTRRR